MATLQRYEKESHFPQVFLELDNLQFSECWYLWSFPDLLWPTLNKKALTDPQAMQCPGGVSGEQYLVVAWTPYSTLGNSSPRQPQVLSNAIPLSLGSL